MKTNNNNLKGFSSGKNTQINSNNNAKNSTIENNNKSRKESKPKVIEQNEEIMKDEKYGEEHIISKLQKKGFECLSLEEMAVTLISPTFEAEYNLKTGGDWNSNFKSKAVERLNRAKFDINWMNKKTNTAFALFFDLVAKGDAQRCLEFMRKNAQYTEEILNSVDQNQKNPLHIAAKNGHYTLVSTLIGKGFSVFVRDKFLRTPLHLASQFGHATVVDILIKSKSDIYAKDSCGRNVLHYACCANSIELLTLLVGQEPELVFSKDNYQRTPLHYVVWNTNPNQLEIAKKLLDANVEIDALDEEGRTPLHYASEAGRGKIIALLVKFGANVSLRDGRLNKTAIELAPTENIREIIIVYSGVPYSPKQDDLQFLNRGPDVDKMNPKSLGYDEEQMKMKRGRQKSQPKTKLSTVVEERDDLNENRNNFNDFVMRSQKEKMQEFLRNIQDYGIKSLQHLTNPSVYTGSWIENINNLEDFYKFIKKCDSCDAVIRVFNLLYPYDKNFPNSKGEEKLMSLFFGGNNTQMNNVNESNLNNNINMNSTITQTLKGEIDKQNLQLSEQKNEINFLMSEIKNLQNLRQNGNMEDLDNLRNELAKYKAENENLKKNFEEIKGENKILNTQLDSYKERMNTSHIKEQKSGDIIKTLTKNLNEMKAELTRIKDQEKKIIQSNISNNLGFSIKIADFSEERDEYSLDDEKSIYLFLKLIEEKTLGLDKLLIKYDRDNDMYIFKTEFIALLEDVALPLENRTPIIKLAGFSDTRIKMPIRNIIDQFYKREERKYSKMNELLFSLAYILHNNLIEIEKVYSFLRLNDDGELTFNELKQGLNSLDIIVPEKDIEDLFRCLDINSKGKIRLDNFVDNLKVRKTMLDEIDNIDEKMRQTNKKFKIISELEEISPENKGKSFYDDRALEEKVERKERELKKSLLNFEEDNNKSVEFNKNEMLEEKELNGNVSSNQFDNHSHILKIEDENNEVFNNNNISSTENVNMSQVNQTRNNYSNVEKEENKSNIQDKTMKSEKKSEIEEDIVNTEEKEKIKQDNSSLNNSVKNPSNKSNKKENFLDKFLDGELKVQVKNAKNLLLPKTLKKPYKFYLSLSLEGANENKALDSRVVENKESLLIVFNWAARVPLLKRQLKEIGVYLKVEMYCTGGESNLPFTKLGESLINWTTTIQQNNMNKWIINENSPISSKNKKNYGFLNVQLKYIPVGSEESYYDKLGKLLRVPKSMQNFISSKVKEIDNNDIIQHIGGNEVLNNNLKSTYRFQVEVTNIENKHFIGENDSYFLVIIINEVQVFTTRDSSFVEIVNMLPYLIEFESELGNNNDPINLEMILKEALETNDEDIGKIQVKIENKPSSEVIDKFALEINNESLLKTLKTEINFFLKIVMEKQ